MIDVRLEGGPRDGETIDWRAAAQYFFPEITREDRLIDHVYELHRIDAGEYVGRYKGIKDRGSWSEISRRHTAENIRWLFEDFDGDET